jgi:hypothetical protein
VIKAGPKLSDAELVLAREYGFASWSALHDYLSSPAAHYKDELRQAIDRNDVDAARRLLDAHPLLLRARFEPHNDTPLHRAVAGDRVNMVELLLERGADLSAKNSWAATPLVHALIRGNAQLAELLVARGAPVVSLVAAAGVGDLALIRSFWDDQGNLKPGAAEPRCSRSVSPARG